MGSIDSINFSNYAIESLFKNNNNYIIEDIKTIGVFKPKRWSETFGKALTRNIIEAKIIHTSTGLTIPLKRYASAKHIQIIEFAGINGYTDKSKLLKEELIKLLPILEDCIVKRIDICFDFPKIPNSIIKNLCSNKRRPFKYINTVYYKTPKEKKTNNTLDIKSYNKQKKDNLLIPMERLEFVFKGQYLKDISFKEIDKSLLKIQRSIKKFSGINCKIFSIS